MDIKFYLNKQSRKIDKALDAYLPASSERPSKLHQAMRYAVFPGGKRIRPILALEACRVVGGDEKKILPTACALELIHNYSLVHDDLPCMDNDALRRGRPTCHKKFGENAALLVGDALLTLAFKILSQRSGSQSLKSLAQNLDASRWIAEAIGTYGMIGGQAVDIGLKGKEIDLPTIDYINTHKSGALIAVALRAGALLGGGSEKEIESLYHYGRYTGLLFQIVDDILDKEGYSSLVGVHEAKKEAETLLFKAQKELKIFKKKGQFLSQIARFVLTRKY